MTIPEKDYSHRKFVNTFYMTRDDVVPFYVNLIISNPNDVEIKRVNDLILSKWSPSGLLYIKDKAWKRVEAIQALDCLKSAVLSHKSV